MKRTVFRGSAAALITPMREDGSVDAEALAALADAHEAAGTDALAVGAYTGEGDSLTVGERLEAVACCRRRTRGRLPILAGASGPDALEIAAWARAAGADAVLLEPPASLLSQESLFRYIAAAADTAGLPVLVQGSGRRGRRISPRTYRRLSALPNVCGAVEDGTDIARIADIRAACGGSLAVYSSGDGETAAVLALGGKGVVSALSNLVPEETHRLCFSFFRGDAALCQQDQLYWLPLIRALGRSPVLVKEALRLAGKSAGPCRGGAPLPASVRVKLRRALSDAGLLSRGEALPIFPG